MLRVLQIGMGWFPNEVSGLDRYFRGLAEHLEAEGIACRGVVVSNGSRPLDAPFPIVPISGSMGPVKRMAALARTVHGIVDEWKPDLIASHFAFNSWLARTRVPVLTHFHGPWSLESGLSGANALEIRAKLWIERRAYRRSRRSIVLSDEFGKLLCSRYGVNPESVSVIPGGVDLVAFSTGLEKPDARRELGLNREGPILLSVRRLEHRMGLSSLIEAMPAVAEAYSGVQLLIVGDGSLRDQLSAEVRSRGLEATVRLVGRVSDEDLAHYYRAADLTVLPSQALEGFGLTIVESLGCGTPVLATPVGGMPEVLADLSRSLITSHRGAEAIGASIIQLLGGTDLPDGATCRSFAEERYGWSSVARRVVQVYHDAAS
jgi:glycosyltransferase involved in cell wall biosynthesis